MRVILALSMLRPGISFEAEAKTIPNSGDATAVLLSQAVHHGRRARPTNVVAVPKPASPTGLIQANQSAASMNQQKPARPRRWNTRSRAANAGAPSLRTGATRDVGIVCAIKATASPPAAGTAPTISGRAPSGSCRGEHIALLRLSLILPAVGGRHGPPKHFKDDSGRPTKQQHAVHRRHWSKQMPVLRRRDVAVTSVV